MKSWPRRPRGRPAARCLVPIVYFDARLKIRDESTVKNKAVSLALGIDTTVRKDVLGLWIEQTESAKFWLKVFNDLKQRGVADILIAVVDGLRGSPRPSRQSFPKRRANLHRATSLTAEACKPNNLDSGAGFRVTAFPPTVIP